MKWIRIFVSVLLLIIVAVSSLIFTAFKQQDRLVKQVIDNLNQGFKGKLEVGGSHISPFENFPYVSIDFEDIHIFESKTDSSALLAKIADTYVGFDIWALLSGDIKIKKIKLDSGFLKIVQFEDGSLNITKVLTNESTRQDESNENESFNIDLQNIELVNMDLLKLNKENNLLIEAFITDASTSFKSAEEGIKIALESQFLFNLILDEDTTFLHDKNVRINTSLTLESKTNVIFIDPSEVLFENSLFQMTGSIDIDDDLNLNLNFNGRKSNFDLFLAFAPPELVPVLDKYDNGGQIYFDANIEGKSINGNNPAIELLFGCKEAFVKNTSSDEIVEDVFFEGYFTNGENRDPTTMKLIVSDFSAKPETGIFKGNILVNNFDSPEIDIQLISNFNLDFLFNFLEIENLEELTGEVSLEMNFHDIIDLSQPEKSLERLNESYFTKLNVIDLNLKSSEFPLPITDLNIQVEMDGQEAQIQQLDFKIGGSDVAITAKVSDLPAIIHHLDIPVEASLHIKSSLIDLEELTTTDSVSSIQEKINDLSLAFRFNSSARAFTESPNLPLGEFFVENLYAKFNNYPHELHDFNVDVFIDSSNFRILDFTGMIDSSDFHFKGRLENYDLWFEKEPVGNTKIDFDLTSGLLKLEDLFSYNGENYVPEDYRHEEFRDLLIHGIAELNFDKKLVNTSIDIHKVEANMKVHPMRFRNFGGFIYFDSTVLKVYDFGGELGNSEFKADMVLELSDQSKKQSSFALRSKNLDFDQLFAYTPPPPTKKMTPEDHEDVFNIFEVPFKNMSFKMDIQSLKYHRYFLEDYILNGRMKEDHYIYLDTMHFYASGGSMGFAGYFDGSDPKEIYFSPIIEASDMDLDKLLFKFENFGQDQLVSDNLHGKLSGWIDGKIRMHADMVPIVNDSEMHMEFIVVDGSINNYPAFEALSDYFSDKNLSNVRFDTLKNTLDLKDGTLTIPSMSINSTLGYFEISGRQTLDMEMEYFVRIPLKVVTKAGFSKLFGKKDQDNSGQIDSIQYKEDIGKSRFLNLKIEGKPDDYRISVGKK